MSKFSKLSSKIQAKEGLSKSSGDKIAAAIGMKKYGAKGMAAKSAAARKK